MAKRKNRKIINVNKILEPPKIKSTENICRKKILTKKQFKKKQDKNEILKKKICLNLKKWDIKNVMKKKIPSI